MISSYVKPHLFCPSSFDLTLLSNKNKPARVLIRFAFFSSHVTSHIHMQVPISLLLQLLSCESQPLGFWLHWQLPLIIGFPNDTKSRWLHNSYYINLPKSGVNTSPPVSQYECFILRNFVNPILQSAR